MLKILEKLGYKYAIIFSIILSVLLSFGVTKFIFFILNARLSRAGLTATIITPLIIATVTLSIVFNFLFKIATLEKEIHRLATLDSLTGVLNRGAFLSSFNSLILLMKRNSSSISLAFLDIDNFKAINDNYGHPAGDKIICSVANTIRGSLRQSDLVGRFGGEEFVIALPNTVIENALIVAEKVKKDIASSGILLDSGAPIKITASIGITSNRTINSYDPDQLIHSGDKAMYNAKKTGKNKVCVAE